MTKLTIDLLPDGGDEMLGAFVAAEYYGGQFTALYALASAGNLELFEGEGLGRLRRELSDAMACAFEQGEIEDVNAMASLLAWVDRQNVGAES